MQPRSQLNKLPNQFKKNSLAYKPNQTIPALKMTPSRLTWWNQFILILVQSIWAERGLSMPTKSKAPMHQMNTIWTLSRQRSSRDQGNSTAQLRHQWKDTTSAIQVRSHSEPDLWAGSQSSTLLGSKTPHWYPTKLTCDMVGTQKPIKKKSKDLASAVHCTFKDTTSPLKMSPREETKLSCSSRPMATSNQSWFQPATTNCSNKGSRSFRTD